MSGMKNFKVISTSFILPFLLSCTIGTLPSETKFSEQRIFEHVLATLQGTMEDFEFNSQFRVSESSSADKSCVRLINCADLVAKISHEFVSCKILSNSAVLNGLSFLDLTQSACVDLISGNAASTFSVTRKFIDFSRVDSSGTTTLKSDSGILGVFDSSSKVWQIFISDVERRTELANREIEKFSIKTESPLKLEGTRANSTRFLIEGSLKVEDLLNEEISTVTPTDLRWNDPTCCYPSSGTMAVLKSGATLSSTLNFQATCGVAKWTDASGNTGELTLTRACE
jgi:hypothetical protein